MSFERWHELKALFAKAHELPPGERASFLEDLRNKDPHLSGRLNELLEIDRHREGVLAQRLTPPPVDLSLSGHRIGAYRMVKEIGRGAASVVYLAERDDEQFARQVAIKVVPRALLSPELCERLKRERLILASLNHPYIAKLLDAGETEDQNAYLVMEFIDGVHLDTYCDARSRSLAERLNLFLKICEAVSFSHQRLIVHRDLKPSNILVTSDGTPKLLDFGIAAVMGPHVPLTLTGLHRFTLEFASPEQIRQDGEPSTSTDVYSLGVLLYRMLSGKLPHKIEDRLPHEVVKAILEEEPTSIREYTNEVPGDLESIVSKALEKEPSNRFSSVEQMSAAIERYLAGFPVRLYRTGPAYVLGKFIRRHRLSLGIGIVLLFSVVGATFTVWRQNRIATRRVKEAVELTEDSVSGFWSLVSERTKEARTPFVFRRQCTKRSRVPCQRQRR